MAKILYSLPSSSAQIERDFGGGKRARGNDSQSKLGATQRRHVRVRLYEQGVHRSHSINSIPPDEISSHILGRMLLAFVDDDDGDDLTNMSEAFSNASVKL